MKAVHKYQIEITERQEIDMPQGAELLSVQLQRGTPCIWARVNPSYPTEPRTIFVAGTGHPLSPKAANARFLGTVQMSGGDLIWHVFDGDRQ